MKLKKNLFHFHLGFDPTSTQQLIQESFFSEVIGAPIRFILEISNTTTGQLVLLALGERFLHFKVITMKRFSRTDYTALKRFEPQTVGIWGLFVRSFYVFYSQTKQSNL